MEEQRHLEQGISGEREIERLRESSNREYWERSSMCYSIGKGEGLTCNLNGKRGGYV